MKTIIYTVITQLFMLGFKPKTVKQLQLSKRNATTLDGKHAEFVSEFQHYKTVIIPQYEEEIKLLQNKLDDYKSDYIKINDLKIRIKKLQTKIKSLKRKEQDYYLQNSQHIFSYFERKKGLEDGQSATRKLDNFFNVSKSNGRQDALGAQCDESVRRYLHNIDESFLDLNDFVIQEDICRLCHKGEMVPIEHDGMTVCKTCGFSSKLLVENEKPSYKEPPKEVCFYAYRRINHFREVLAQFQAKETTHIPDEVLSAIQRQARKERIPLTQEWFDNTRAKEMLKKLGLNRYYEHIPYIKDKLGIRPPIMSPELEEVLCNLFMALQAPYAKYCPDERCNFLNYYYTGYKLCELVDQRQFLPYFQMLKDDDKLNEQDEIWQKMCKELDWPFIPTERRTTSSNKNLWQLNSAWEEAQMLNK